MIPTFLAPWFLAGIAAISIPLVLHFLFKARYRKLPWAAMSFLKLSIEQTRRRVRFQELILLILRCATLILLALAFARPTWNNLVGNQGESIDAVFVIDASISMSAQDGEMTRFDRAKQAALKILESLPNGSTIQIVKLTDRAEYLGPERLSNREHAAEILRSLEPTGLADDALLGLMEADLALERGSGATAEIYYFSDLQQSGWIRQASAIRAQAEILKQKATLIIVQCGNPERQLTNVRIETLRYAGGIPYSRSRLPVTVVVKNTGRLPAKNLTVTLEVPGSDAMREIDSIEELAVGESIPITFSAKLNQAGPQLLRATVSADDLPGDNQRDQMILVKNRVNVLLIDGSVNPRDPKLSASHYVLNALLPIPLDQQPEYPVQVQTVPVEEAAAGLLRTADVCILTNVAATSGDRPGVSGLSAEFALALKEFVINGGGLLITSGDNMMPNGYNTTLGLNAHDLLPAAIAAEQLAVDPAPLKPAAETALAGSYLARFREEPFLQVTSEVEFTRWQKLENLHPQSQVLLRYHNEEPWVVSRSVGQGKVILVTSTMDFSYSNWPAKAGSFLSFVQLTLNHLSSLATDELNYQAGDRFRGSLPVGKTWDWLPPVGTRQAMPPGSTTLPRLELAGAYRVLPAGAEPTTNDLIFCVAPDLNDTDNLDPLPQNELEELLGYRPVILNASLAKADRLSYERSRRDWTIPLLLCLFVLVVGESWWAWFCGRAI